MAGSSVDAAVELATAWGSGFLRGRPRGRFTGIPVPSEGGANEGSSKAMFSSRANCSIEEIAVFRHCNSSLITAMIFAKSISFTPKEQPDTSNRK